MNTIRAIFPKTGHIFCAPDIGWYIVTVYKLTSHLISITEDQILETISEYNKQWRIKM